MIETKYIRDREIIRSVAKKEDGGPLETLVFDSISRAKKRSRKMQMEHGGLGQGYVSLLKETKKRKRPNKYGYKGKNRTQEKELQTSNESLNDALVDIYRESLKRKYRKIQK